MKCGIVGWAGLLLLVVGCGNGGSDADLAGQWHGRLGGFEITGVISGDTTFSGTFILPAAGGELTTPVLVRGDSVLINLNTESMGTVVLAGLYQDTLIDGTFVLEGAERKFFLRRSE